MAHKSQLFYFSGCNLGWISLNLLTKGCLMEEVGTFGQKLFKILLKVSSGFLWTFGNLYFESLGVIIVITINHQLPDPIEIQNIGKVKAMENSTILHRRYEALAFWCTTCVTKIVMKTENSTRLMCSHDKNHHKEKRKWSKLNPLLPKRCCDEMGWDEGTGCTAWPDPAEDDPFLWRNKR